MFFNIILFSSFSADLLDLGASECSSVRLRVDYCIHEDERIPVRDNVAGPIQNHRFTFR